jgi:hypothetical protein
LTVQRRQPLRARGAFGSCLPNGAGRFEGGQPAQGRRYRKLFLADLTFSDGILAPGRDGAAADGAVGREPVLRPRALGRAGRHRPGSVVGGVDVWAPGSAGAIDVVSECSRRWRRRTPRNWVMRTVPLSRVTTEPPTAATSRAMPRGNRGCRLTKDTSTRWPFWAVRR